MLDLTIFDALSTKKQNEIKSLSFKFKKREFDFPTSYLDFASKLGYGLFCELFIIYPPFSPFKDTDCDSFDERMNTIRGFIDIAMTEEYLGLFPDGDDELVQNLIPFGASENGEYLCWDTRRLINNEYPIYVIGSRMASITYGASSLFELTEKLISSDIKSILGLSYDALELSFKSFSIVT